MSALAYGSENAAAEMACMGTQALLDGGEARANDAIEQATRALSVVAERSADKEKAPVPKIVERRARIIRAEALLLKKQYGKALRDARAGGDALRAARACAGAERWAPAIAWANVALKIGEQAEKKYPQAERVAIDFPASPYRPTGPATVCAAADAVLLPASLSYLSLSLLPLSLSRPRPHLCLLRY